MALHCKATSPVWSWWKGSKLHPGGGGRSHPHCDAKTTVCGWVKNWGSHDASLRRATHRPLPRLHLDHPATGPFVLPSAPPPGVLKTQARIMPPPPYKLTHSVALPGVSRKRLAPSPHHRTTGPCSLPSAPLPGVLREQLGVQGSRTCMGGPVERRYVRKAWAQGLAGHGPRSLAEA